MAARLHRRRFLGATAAGTLGYFFTATAFSAARAYQANEKLGFAGIGVGGKGSSDIDHAGQLGDVVALCDIDDEAPRRAKAKKWPEAKTLHRLPQAVRRRRDHEDVDAVTVSTPDHTHAPAGRAGDADGQARLLPEAADPHRLRSPPAARGGRRRTASARRWATRAPPRTACAGRSRSSRPACIGDGEGSPRLDQPPDLAAGPEGR